MALKIIQRKGRSLEMLHRWKKADCKSSLRWAAKERVLSKMNPRLQGYIFESDYFEPIRITSLLLPFSLT